MRPPPLRSRGAVRATSARTPRLHPPRRLLQHTTPAAATTVHWRGAVSEGADGGGGGQPPRHPPGEKSCGEEGDSDGKTALKIGHGARHGRRRVARRFG